MCPVDRFDPSIPHADFMFVMLRIGPPVALCGWVIRCSALPRLRPHRAYRDWL
jgi:hypothetical protein